MSEPVVFNPDPKIETVSLGSAGFYLVIDDALAEPERMRQFAVRNALQFDPPKASSFPGPRLPLPEVVLRQLKQFFHDHIRDRLGASSVERATCRLAMVTTPESELAPAQCIPHTDSRVGVEANQLVAASVLFLFEDPRLGGTNFFVPAPQRSGHEIEALMADSLSLSSEQFHSRYAIPRAYQVDSNSYFERVGSIAPRWNRMAFYWGSILHSGDIRHPERLEDDPKRGRLMLNGFFTCTV